MNTINNYANPSFNPSEEALEYFSKGTVDQYRGFSHQLDQLKYETENSLKESVYDHYAEFIGFSAEIQKMDDSMEQLKRNLNRTYKVLDNLKDISLAVETSDEIIHAAYSFVIPEELAWIKSVCDDIDLFIFQRRFTEAVELCIRAKNTLSNTNVDQNPLLMDLVTQINNKSEFLTKKIVVELFSPESSRSDRRRLCRLLSGLGHEEQSRLLYLERTSNEIHNHHRFVKPCGDIPSLITGLSELFFECLQDTAVNFQALFCKEDSSVYSIFIAWLVKEIKRFVQQIVVYAIGDSELKIRNSAGFETFAGCVIPVLQGATLLEDIGCQIDCYIVEILGDKLNSITTSLMNSIISNLQHLSAPEPELTTLSIKTLIGLERRELSVHCAALYGELNVFIQQCPQLLTASLLPYIITPLIKGFSSIFAIETTVYEKWVKDKSNRKPSIVLGDLYFLTTELLPILSALFLPKMGEYGCELNSVLNNFKSGLKSYVMVIIQDCCMDMTNVMKFNPNFYISFHSK